MTEAVDLRELTAADLREREKELRDQLFRLRMQRSMGQLEGASKVRSARKDLARVLTVLREKNGPARQMAGAESEG